MEIINLTAHAVVTPTHRWESSGIARCQMEESQTGSLEGLPVYQVSLGQTTGLPAAEEGTAYIVSRAVAEANSRRRDLYFPHQTYRDSEGRIAGCKAFAQAVDPSGFVFPTSQ